MAVLVLLARMNVRAAAKAEIRAPATTELELDERVLEPEERAAPSRSIEEGSGSHAEASRQVATTRHMEAPAAPSDEERPRESLENWTFAPTAVPSVDLGLGSSAGHAGELLHRAGTNGEVGARALTAAGGPEPEARAAPTTGGLTEALSAGDVAAGMARGGAVLTAAEDAARADPIVAGEATFEVTVWRDGTNDVRMVASSGEVEEWGHVASALASQVKGRVVRFPAGADGLKVRVHLDAKWKLADGRDIRSLHGPRVAVKPSVLQRALEGKIPLEERASTGAGGPDQVGGGPTTPPPMGGALGSSEGPNPLGAAVQGIAQRVLPTPSVSVSGKVCTATLAVTPVGIGIGGGCSMENIGTPPTHSVAGQIVREEAVRRADAGSSARAVP